MATESAGKRQLPFYTGDKQLARRVQEHLDSFPPGKYVDPVSVADSLQQSYREYGRRKILAFRKSVQRVCDWVAKQKAKQARLDAVEQKHLAKRRKQDKYNGEGTTNRKDWMMSDDSSESSFSDIDDYVECKDTNMVNEALNKLYSKGTPSTSNSPGHSLKSHRTSHAGTPDTTPGRPDDGHGEADSDSEGMELGNLSMDAPNEEVDEERPRRKTEMMLPRTSAKESTPAPSGTSTPLTGSKKQKDKKRKASNQTIAEEESAAKKGRMGQERGRKAKKKIVEPQLSTVTFSDIGGNDDTLHELCKLLIHMRHPEVYQQLGVTPPRGVLLHGPPGCGKTLLAHAIAGELQLPFLKIAATEIVSGVSGESEGNIRDLFEEAMGLAPCILFLDEIDAITPKRETAQREMERRIVAQLLSCMDDLSTSPLHVLVIGATNRADSLDPALRRAGRFDREICLGIPGVKERERILQVLCRNLRLSPDFSFTNLSSLTPGYVGADLMSLCREAAMCAVNRIFQDLQLPSQTVPPQPITDGTSVLTPSEVIDQGGSSVRQSLVPDSTRGPGTTQEMDIIESADQKPSYHSVLSWLKDHPPLTEEQLEELYIGMKDFEEALPHVQPSAKREGFATIPDVTWDDVGALHSVREELSMAILAPVRNPVAFKTLGLANPPGILLAGPPGCGKTLLAKAIANESGINFISVKGPELMNMYVGESERAVRQCFHRARNSAPCVIFFDELDALCPKRSDSPESGSSARVVNQLLTEMDGLEARKQVFIVGATNRPDIIDPAVLRPGRLDKTLYVGIPSPEDRVAILKTITKNGTRPPLAEDVILDAVGQDQRCEGFTGADLAALVREASMAALRAVLWSVPSDSNQRDDSTERGTEEARLVVTAVNFESAFAKVKASVSKKDRERYRRMRLNALDLTTLDGQKEETATT